MRKVLHVFKCIILLAYLVFLILCGHSCIMTLFRNSIPASEGGDLSAPVSEAVTQPVAQPKNENEVALSSGLYEKTADYLAAVVTPADLALLDQFTALQSADFSGSTCYAEIQSWAQSHPDVSVRYCVTLPEGQSSPVTPPR